MRRGNKWLTTITAACLALGCASGVAWAGDKPQGTLKQRIELGLSGVSPHADLQSNGTTRLYYPSFSLNGTAIAQCTVKGACEMVGSLQGISDLTDVVTADGSRRAYYIVMDPNSKRKEIYTAPMTADGLALGEGISLGINDGGAMAWGVPDAVVIPDGRVRIYWVEPDPQGRRASEVIVSATSTDTSGTSFVRDRGYRTTRGIVDFEVLNAKTGAWLAIAATTPEDPKNPQRLLLASSKDGLKWKINRKSLTPSSMSYLDPTGIRIGPRRYRIYYAKAPNALGERAYALEQAVLTGKKKHRK